MVGGSNSAYWQLLLPVELSSFLMPGCWLYTDIVGSYAVSGSTVARWSMPVPLRPELVGATFYQQAMVYEPTANARGFTTSNALASTIGSRN